MEFEMERQKALVVDDSEANIQLLSEFLSPICSVFFAMNGEEAIRLADTLRPDIILLDVMMPGMDGYEVCRRIKANNDLKDIPIIFVTAMGSEDDEAKGLELGAIDYISKPISPAIVKARVKNHLELKRYRDLLERISLIDGLTGIPNRREFDMKLGEEWRRAIRNGELISLIMMDIDFFKNYNDHYGHLAGDDCLRKVAKALVSTMKRPGDMVARYGGEEFACILPDTDTQGALIVAEMLLNSVSDLKIPHATSTVADHITISIGFASKLPDPGTSHESLILEADTMLYNAKKHGRKRIMWDRALK